MNKQLTLGSLFDGSGGFPLGGMLCGITPIWASEIEPFPIRVTTKRIPSMKHLGNISKIKGSEIEPVDIITFGSPCQDLSLAGGRKGLGGARSVLFYEAVRIVKEMREKTNGEYPKYIVWENVAGAFSSNSGEDFRAVLEEIVSICEEGRPEVPAPCDGKWPHADMLVGDGWSIAYRTLDAQYWGVPQRRKRIYLVADLRGGRAGEILFEQEGMPRDTEKSSLPWQRTSVRIEGSAHDAGICLNDQGGQRMDVTEDMTSTLRAKSNHPPCIMQSAVSVENYPSDSRVKVRTDGKSQTLTSHMGTGGNNVPLVMETPKTMKIRCGKAGGGKGALVQEDRSATLGCNNDQVLFEPYCIGNGQVNQLGLQEKTGALNCMDSQQNIIAQTSYGIDRAAFNQGKNAKFGFAVEEELEPTMVAKGPNAVAHFSSSKASFFTSAEKELANTLVATDYKDPPLVNGKGYIVRRLTPKECARLQGFPDGWCSGLGTEEPSDEEIRFFTDVFEEYRKATAPDKKPKTEKQILKWLKDPHSDSAEYKMWGNGVALPCVYFVLYGIAHDSSE